MKRQNKNSKRTTRRIHLWTFAQSQAAVPYLRSITQSLREHRLEALTHHQRAQRLAAKPGKPDRATLTAEQDERAAAERSHQQFAAVLEELEDLDVFCVDPLNGVAVIPFRQYEQLAWLVFDLFEDAGLKAWRYDTDPLDTRHPLNEVEQRRELSV